MKNSSTTKMDILHCLKSCWHKIVRKTNYTKILMPLSQTVLSCSYIYNAEEIPEPPSQIIAILSTHLLI